MERQSTILAVFIFIAATFVTVFGTRISLVGNPVVDSTHGMAEDGYIFLLTKPIPYEGVVLGFSTVFRANSSLRLQVWRHLEQSAAQFRLLGEMAVRSNVLHTKQDIYFQKLEQNSSCIHVHKGDYLGVFLEARPVAIPYTQADFPQTFYHRMDNQVLNPTPIGDVVQFKSTSYPWEFPVSAYVDMDVEGYIPVQGGDLVWCEPKRSETTLPSVTEQVRPHGGTVPTSQAVKIVALDFILMCWYSVLHKWICI